jgi:hypothetical protein
MSLLDHFFDNDYRQRHDIESVRDATAGLAGSIEAVGAGVSGVRQQVHELGMVVHVLMTMLAEKGLLDVQEIRQRLAQEAVKPTKRVEAAPHPATCVHCGATMMSNELVTIGADRWCRACAANP